MSTPTHEIIGSLHILARDLSSDDGLGSFCKSANDLVTQAASRLQELDNEVTQLRLQLEKFERKAKKTGTGGVG